MLADTIGQLNPLRYRGYVYDTETGLYYLQSRYYDPETGRFVNGDGLVSTGQGVVGNNMFAYCLNDPVNMVDVGGDVPQWLKDFWNGVVEFTKNTFGAGSSTEHQWKNEVEMSPDPISGIISWKSGVANDVTVSSHGDSSKPISVYGVNRSDNVLASTAGIRLQTKKHRANLCVGLDNISVTSSYIKGNNMISWGVRIDIAHCKAGIELSTTDTSWDENTSRTKYDNISVTAAGLVGLYYFLTTGQWLPAYQGK